MRFDSTFSTKRREKILRSYMLSTSSSSRIRTLCTTCSKIQSMLTIMAPSRRLYSSFLVWIKGQGTKPIFSYLEMISIRKLACLTMLTKMNGLLKSYQTIPVTNFTSVQLLSLWVQSRFSLLVVVLHQRKIQEFTWLRKMKFWTKPWCMKVEMLMPLPFVKDLCLF